jgi:hypothetical protein
VQVLVVARNPRIVVASRTARYVMTIFSEGYVLRCGAERSAGCRRLRLGRALADASAAVIGWLQAERLAPTRWTAASALLWRREGVQGNHDPYREAAFRRLDRAGASVDERIRGGSSRRAGEGAASGIHPMTVVS